MLTQNRLLKQQKSKYVEVKRCLCNGLKNSCFALAIIIFFYCQVGFIIAQSLLRLCHRGFYIIKIIKWFKKIGQ